MTIHLQGMGDRPAITAGEVAVGMVQMFNYGYTHVITGVNKLNDRWVELTYHIDGKEWKKKRRTTTKIAVVVR